MVRLKFLKEVGECKVGDIVEWKTEETAEEMVEEGVAEYFEEKTMEDLKNIQRYLENDGKKTIIKDNKVCIISQEEKENYELIEILKRKDLFNEITEKELDKKIVGEKKSRKVIFLCACGCLVKNCQIASFNLLVNDEAGTGKDYVTAKTLEIFPKEMYIKKTRISPTVFTYWHNAKYEPEWTWNGKVFYTEDISETVLNSEVFKVMCSSGSSATVVIRQRAVDIPIKGKPVVITTTATSIPNPELTRRFEFLSLDESIDQTREIMKRHSKYAQKGLSQEYDEKYTNAIALLKRVDVVIPYAEKLHDLFPQDSIMMRTKYPRFLDYIKASASFHQFQRDKKNGKIIANGQDYDIAREIIVKISSNRYMISLTRNQRKIVEFFEKNPFFVENATKINEKMHNFMSLPALLTNLGILTKYGILESFFETNERGREIEKYKLSSQLINMPFKGLKLPNFKELKNISVKVTKPIKVTKGVKST